MNHDRNLFVQTEMLKLLEEFPAELLERHPLQFLMHLDHFRQKADQHDLGALRDLSSALETALQPLLHRGGGVTTARFYCEAMRTALDMQEMNAVMTETLMANVALRLGGQP